MIGVVGDIEAHDFLILAVLIFDVRELEAAIFVSVVRLHRGLSLIFEHGRYNLCAVGDGEMDAVALLPSYGIEGACSEEGAQHVEGTLRRVRFMPNMCAVVLLLVLLEVCLSTGI